MQSQWVDLGIHTEACITQPETCTAGGTISMWVNIEEDATSVFGIVSSWSDHTKRTGIVIVGDGDNI